MKILFVTSECAPFSKSGGLADVAFSLPPALKEAGNEIAVITPLYQCVRAKYGDTLTKVSETTIRLGGLEASCGLYRDELSGVTVWFVENDSFIDGLSIQCIYDIKERGHEHENDSYRQRRGLRRRPPGALSGTHRKRKSGLHQLRVPG